MIQAQEQGPQAVMKIKALMEPGEEKERGEATFQYSLKPPPYQKVRKRATV